MRGTWADDWSPGHWTAAGEDGHRWTMRWKAGEAIPERVAQDVREPLRRRVVVAVRAPQEPRPFRFSTKGSYDPWCGFASCPRVAHPATCSCVTRVAHERWPQRFGWLRPGPGRPRLSSRPSRVDNADLIQRVRVPEQRRSPRLARRRPPVTEGRDRRHQLGGEVGRRGLDAHLSLVTEQLGRTARRSSNAGAGRCCASPRRGR